MKLAIIAAALAVAVGLSGCATTALSELAKNQSCTTKVKGHLAVGSITPTGDLDVNAVCTHPAAPKAADVAEPKAKVDAPAAAAPAANSDAPHA